MVRSIRSVKGRVGAILAAIVVGGILLTLVGCGGDGGSNVPEVAGPEPVGRQEPVARDDTARTDEDRPVAINVLANDRDPDGDALSVVSLVQPAHGTATINPDHTVTYAPEPRFHGIDQKTAMSMGGSIGAASTAYQYDWNMLPIGQQLWLEHLLTYEKYPPMQAPATWNLTQVLEQVKKANHASD